MLAIGLLACSRQPDIGPNEAVWKELEALYTAVNSPSRVELLAESSVRLEQLHADGQLNESVHRLLTEIIDQAERGERRPAAERLYALMRAQRRPE